MFTIAGVTGHVGSIVAKELLAKGEPIKAIVRDQAKAVPWSKQGAEIALGSLGDQKFLTGVLRGSRGLFVLLPPPSPQAPDFYAAQREMADAIAGAVKESGVPHVVLLSSVGADLAEGNGPIRGLNYLENALRSTGTKLTAIRAGYFQENVAMSFKSVQQTGVFPSFTPTADIPMPMNASKDIGHLAAELLLAQPSRHEVIDLVGPLYTNRQIATKIGEALGKAVNVVDIPQSNWVGALQQAGMPESLAKIFAEMYAGFASGAIRPKGDRAVHVETKLEETMKSFV